MREVKHFFWGLLVLFLTSSILWLQFDQDALDLNLIYSDGSRDLLVIDHLAHFRDSWLISPVNASTVLPSLPVYYWLLTVLYILAIGKLPIFFLYYTIWLAVCSLLLFLSLSRLVGHFKAMALACLFAIFFSNGTLSSTLFQPMFALPVTFFFLWYLLLVGKKPFTLRQIMIAFFLILFAIAIHYSNIVVALLLPICLLLTKKKFSEKQLFFGLAALCSLTVVFLSFFQTELLKNTIELLMRSSELYFGFKNLLWGLVIINFGLFFYFAFLKPNPQGAQFLFLSGVLLYLVFLISPALRLFGFEPSLFYGLSTLLSSVFFLLHGVSMLLPLKVNLVLQQWLVGLTTAMVVWQLITGPLILQTSDLKETNAYLIGEYLAKQYFTSRIPFTISVAYICGDLDQGEWFSGGIWWFFEKITGENVICLEQKGQNFQACYGKSVSRIYYVCKETRQDFQVPEIYQRVFKTRQGWQVFLQP